MYDQSTVIVWHDEQDVSWSYCGGFKIYAWGTNLFPSRSPVRNSFRLWRNDNHCIGDFPDLSTAKLIASIIRTSEK